VFSKLAQGVARGVVCFFDRGPKPKITFVFLHRLRAAMPTGTLLEISPPF